MEHVHVCYIFWPCELAKQNTGNKYNVHYINIAEFHQEIKL